MSLTCNRHASVHRTSARPPIQRGYKIPISNVTGSQDGKKETGLKPGEPSTSEQCRSIRIPPFFVSSLVWQCLGSHGNDMSLNNLLSNLNTAKLDSDAWRIRNWLPARLLPLPYCSCTKNSSARGKKTRVYLKKCQILSHLKRFQYPHSVYLTA